MKKSAKLDVKSLPTLLSDSLQKLSRYGIILFLLLLASVYGYVLYKIDILSNAQPNSSDVSAQVSASNIPHLDQSVINQLESLQNNSVSVKTLFDQARSNPFQE